MLWPVTAKLILARLASHCCISVEIIAMMTDQPNRTAVIFDELMVSIWEKGESCTNKTWLMLMLSSFLPYSHCDGRKSAMYWCLTSDSVWLVQQSEDVDLNAEIHGNWTLDNAKSRLHQFLQQNRIQADYKYTIVGPDHNRYIYLPLVLIIMWRHFIQVKQTLIYHKWCLFIIIFHLQLMWTLWFR